MTTDIVPTPNVIATASDQFMFPDTGDAVRTIVDGDGNPWFIANDVAHVLGLGNVRSSIAGLDPDEKAVHTTDTPGGLQGLAVINEAGLYSLILRSRKPEAKTFKRWVTHDVLPAIRKTGQYVAIPKTYAEALRAAADAVEQTEQVKAQLAIAAPKVEAFDTYLSATGKYLVGEVAKMLNVPNMGPVKLHDFLRARGVLMSGGAKHNMPYQRHIETGRFTVEGAVRRNATTGELITREDGEPISARTTHVTPKGVEYIRSLLVQAGHQPQRLEITA